MIVNKSDLINQLSQKFSSALNFDDIEYSVKKILDHISKSLYLGDRV